MTTHERSRRFSYSHGAATICLLRAENRTQETDAVIRYWNAEPQSWWDIPAHPAYKGMARRIYNHWVKEETRLCRMAGKKA